MPTDSEMWGRRFQAKFFPLMRKQGFRFRPLLLHPEVWPQSKKCDYIFTKEITGKSLTLELTIFVGCKPTDFK